jgi:acetyltransferase-like isoleucine patch superfamily enzyme
MYFLKFCLFYLFEIITFNFSNYFIKYYIYKSKIYKLNIFTKFYLKNKGVQFGTNLYLNSTPIIPFKGDLIIGNNCNFGENTYFYLHEKIIIGNNFLGSPNIKFITGDHKLFSKQYSGRSIYVGNNVWIGYSTIILPGSYINNNVVIAAGSVVKNVLEEGFLYAGVPAKKIKKVIS